MIVPCESEIQSDEGRFVEVLTTPLGARKLGYCLGGARPGPQVLVAGHGPVAETVFDRLLGLPTLPWLRGRLLLFVLDALDEVAGDGEPLALLGEGRRIDEILFLPCADTARDADAAAAQGCRSVLRLCARLGMIEGRGVH